MKISFGFPTCRRECGLEWFVDALEWQAKELGFDLQTSELVVVDSVLWEDEVARRAQITSIVAERIPLVHVPPKPNPWQGPARLTKKEYTAHASVRNTVFCHMRGEYLVSMDDCSVPQPGWLVAMLESAEKGRLVSGSYAQHRQMVVEKGKVCSFVVGARDQRTGGFARAPGGWFFTGTFGCSWSIAVRLNGFDELYDGLVQEDCDFGCRAERAGIAVWYDPRAMIVQSVEKKREASYGGARPWRLGDDLQYLLPGSRGRIEAEGNAFVLEELRARILAGGTYPPVRWYPDNHWAKRLDNP